MFGIDHVLWPVGFFCPLDLVGKLNAGIISQALMENAISHFASELASIAYEPNVCIEWNRMFHLYTRSANGDFFENPHMLQFLTAHCGIHCYELRTEETSQRLFGQWFTSIEFGLGLSAIWT